LRAVAEAEDGDDVDGDDYDDRWPVTPGTRPSFSRPRQRRLS